MERRRHGGGLQSYQMIDRPSTRSFRGWRSRRATPAFPDLLPCSALGRLAICFSRIWSCRLAPAATAATAASCCWLFSGRKQYRLYRHYCI